MEHGGILLSELGGESTGARYGQRDGGSYLKEKGLGIADGSNDLIQLKHGTPYGAASLLFT